MLSSIDWNAYEAYRRQIETFRAKDLTDHEVLVMKWMQSEVKRFEEMKKLDERNQNDYALDPWYVYHKY